MTAAWLAYLVATLLMLLGLLLSAVPARLPAEAAVSGPHIALLRRRGRRAALRAAVTELHVADLIAIGGNGTLRRGGRGKVRGDLSELARALYRTLVVPRSLRSAAIRAPVRAALRSLTHDLVGLGAVPTTTRWRLSRLALIGSVVVTLQGVTHVGPLPPLMLLLALGLLVAATAAWSAPRRTVAGARLLRGLRREHAERSDTRTAEELAGATPAQAARVNALTGAVLPGLEPALRRRARDQRLTEGRMDIGDGVSAGYEAGLSR